MVRKLKVIRPAPPPWFAKGLCFTCTGCGNCCTGGPGYVWISDEEIGRLAAHLGLSVQQVEDRYCRRYGQRWSLNEHRNAIGNYDCVFLKEVPAEPAADGQVTYSRRICSIYPVRPLQCRTWPFWEGNLADPEAWDRAVERCPGMDRGRRFGRRQIELLRDAADWPERSPGSDE